MPAHLSYRQRLTRSLRRVARGCGPGEAVKLAIPIARYLARQPTWLAAGCGDHALFVDMGDIYIGASVLDTGAYGRADFERALAILQGLGRLGGRKVFLDVGANIGTHTVYAIRSRLFERVLAVEPEPGNLVLLKANMALNGLRDRVAVVEAAAGAAPGTARLYVDEINRGGHSVLRRDLPRSVQVPVVRLDEMVETMAAPSEVGLAWIDIEGGEVECLGGMPAMLAAAVPLGLEFNAAKYGEAKTRQFCQALAAHYSSFAVLNGSDHAARPIVELPGIAIPDYGFADIVVF